MRKSVFLSTGMLVILSIGLFYWEDDPGNLQDGSRNVVSDVNASPNGSIATTEDQTTGDADMDIHLNSEDIDEIQVNVGDRVLLESLRQAVVPPYLMIMPFYVLPEFIHFVESRPLDEDGVHGTIFVLDVKAAGQGELTVGFKDMQSGNITHQKVLPCTSID